MPNISYGCNNNLKTSLKYPPPYGGKIRQSPLFPPATVYIIDNAPLCCWTMYIAKITFHGEVFFRENQARVISYTKKSGSEAKQSICPVHTVVRGKLLAVRFKSCLWFVQFLSIWEGYMHSPPLSHKKNISITTIYEVITVQKPS